MYWTAAQMLAPGQYEVRVEAGQVEILTSQIPLG